MNLTEDDQVEAQRLALIYLLRSAATGWAANDMPTVADRLMKSGAVFVDVPLVMRDLLAKTAKKEDV